MYLTGRLNIDIEHKELLSLIDLIKIYLESPYRENIPLLIIIFNAKLVKHCIDEELIMEASREPNIVAHKNAHKELMGLAASLLLKLEMEHSYDYISDDLKKIVEDHIEQYDRPSVIQFSYRAKPPKTYT